jgi:hypothetical protein
MTSLLGGVPFGLGIFGFLLGADESGRTAPDD